eukprot:271428_1
MSYNSQHEIERFLWITMSALILFFFGYHLYISYLWWRRYQYGIKIDAVITNKWTKNDYVCGTQAAQQMCHYYSSNSTSTSYYIEYEFYVEHNKTPSTLYPILIHKFVCNDDSDIFPSDVMHLCSEYLGDPFRFYSIHGPYKRQQKVKYYLYELYRNDNILKIVCDPKHHHNYTSLSSTTQWTTIQWIIYLCVIIAIGTSTIGLLMAVKMIAIMGIVFASLACSVLYLGCFIWLMMKDRSNTIATLQCAKNGNAYESYENEHSQLAALDLSIGEMELQFGVD